MCPQVWVTFRNVQFHELPRSGFRAVACRQKDDDANDRDNKRIVATIPCKFASQRCCIMNISVKAIFTPVQAITMTSRRDSLLFYQLDKQILYFNTFILFLYMFRALLYSSSGGQIVLVQQLVSSLSLGDCSVHRLREYSCSLCTEQSPKESDDTRGTNTICPPEDEHNSVRNMYRSIINILK